jgi:hypothetical protein
MRRFGSDILLLGVVAWGSVAGQAVTIRGTVYDSLHARPLGGAFVALGTQTALTDSVGRFTIEGIPPGNYRITAQHDAVDQLGLSAIGAQVRVTDGHDPVIVSLPSFAGLWRLVCGPTPPAADTGFVFGTARASRATRNTTVSASWIDLTTNGTKVSQKLRTLEVSADSLGNFALCGVPTTTGLSIRARADSAESGEFRLEPLDHERIARRDLTLGAPLAAAITAGRGASISGKILADSGRGPIANADVTLIDVGQSTTTNEHGEYEFKDLPAGSHRLYVRKIGYAEMEVSVDVDEAEHRDRDIVMNRITTLDSMAVTAKVVARDEALRTFEEHRKMGLGKFLTLDELKKSENVKLSTLLRQWPGIYIPSGDRMRTYPQTTRGVKSLGSKCDVAVFFDGRLLDPRVDQDLDHIAPPEILGAIEWYPGASTVPPEYSRLNTNCGVLVLHSRYKFGKPF